MIAQRGAVRWNCYNLWNKTKKATRILLLMPQKNELIFIRKRESSKKIAIVFIPVSRIRNPVLKFLTHGSGIRNKFCPDSGSNPELSNDTRVKNTFWNIFHYLLNFFLPIWRNWWQLSVWIVVCWIRDQRSEIQLREWENNRDPG